MKHFKHKEIILLIVLLKNRYTHYLKNIIKLNYDSTINRNEMTNFKLYNIYLRVPVFL